MRLSSSFLLLCLGATTSLLGCGPIDDGAYASGELGNGGFYFDCSDAVTCKNYSEGPSTFPSAVALSSTFDVRYHQVRRDGVNVEGNVVVSTIGTGISRGPSGFTAVQRGYYTLAARDSHGQIVDYITVHVQKPDGLVVYADEGASNRSPDRIEKVTLEMGKRGSFRAFARAKQETLAGMLAVEWRSSDPSVFEVVEVVAGKAVLAAKGAGTATLYTAGGTFEQSIQVEVKP